MTAGGWEDERTDPGDEPTDPRVPDPPAVDTDLAAPPHAEVLSFEGHTITGLALAQARVPILYDLVVRNPTGTAWRDVTVAITPEPAFCEPWSARLAQLDAYRTRPLQPALSLSPVFLHQQEERVAARLVLTVHVGGSEVARTVHELVVLSPTHWPGIGFVPELLAAWVRPNARALTPLLKIASDRLERRTGEGALCGYQKEDPAHALALVQAGWEALQQSGVDYINPPAHVETQGQRVRPPEEVVGQGLGTCVDLAVTLASLWEQMGLHPFLVVIEGHAFAGAWLTEYAHPEPVLDDVRPLRNRIQLGEAVVVDSSPVASAMPFADAVSQGERLLADHRTFRALIDVRTARGFGVHPLPTDGAPLAHRGAVPDAGRSLAEVTADVRSRWREDQAVEVGPATRVDRWKSKLLDLTLRNRLLNFKASAKSVRIAPCDLGKLEDDLANGQVIELQPRPELRLAHGQGLTPEAREAVLAEALRQANDEAQARGRLVLGDTEAPASKALTALYREHKTAFEESGAITLYLAVGMLAWFEDDRAEQPRLAPLLLVPVELERPSVGGTWKLKPADDESRFNQTLIEKLRIDFGLDVPELAALPMDEAGVDVGLLLQRVRRAIKPMTRWEVLDEVHLARFSFAKFLMWLDLEAKREALARNPIVAKILGESEPTGGGLPPLTLVPEAELDTGRPTQDTVTVLEADPSQLQAVLAARDGGSFVLQGPPGTGKSQTITNMIAALIGAGKTVLFVSEKMAALDVVQRRLERVGLGPFCLELHAHQANKNAVVEQIKQAFEFANQRPPDGWQRTCTALQDHRDALNAHAARLAAPSPFRAPLREVLASLFTLRSIDAVALPDIAPLELTLQDVDAALEAGRALTLALSDLGAPSDHPWRGVTERNWGTAWEQDVLRTVRQVQATTQALRSSADAARQTLQWTDDGEDLDAMDTLAEVCEVARDTPGVPAALLQTAGARDRLDQLRAWIALGRQAAAIRDELRARWRDELLALPLDDLLARHRRWGSTFLVRVFTLYSARSALGGVAVGRLPSEAVITTDLDAAVRLAGLIRQLDAASAEATAWLGRRWQGVDTAWDEVDAVLAWADRANRALLTLSIGDRGARAAPRLAELATDLAELVQAGGPLRGPLDAFVDAHRRQTAARTDLARQTGWQARRALGATATLSDVSEWCEHAVRSADRLRPWCLALAAMADARDRRLGPVVDALLAGTLPPGEVSATVERSLKEAWFNASVDADPALRSFRGVTHGALIARFRALELETAALAQQVAVAAAAARVPRLDAPGDGLALLRRQLTLKRRHMPVRKLFDAVGDVLRRIKPCTLMSPLSVAQYLGPDQQGYDVVIFDEASQIPPWDAVGAIARGTQVVIVGDSKQLPPTSFFSRGIDEDASDDLVEDLESILDEAVAVGLPALRLRWHYRSRHESLILFSNYHYYDNALHTFPSAQHKAPGLGVSFRHVPDGVYDRGGSRTNRREAEVLVSEMFALLEQPAAERPTVGVVTFSQAQQILVEELVEAELRNRPHLASCFADSTDEKVFVKNLENVQGDERDVMLFGIGYGPDSTGRVYMNLGPMTKEGGERRLNVAVTRARERLIVVSTLRHEDLRVGPGSSLGLRHLKTFLHYAEVGMPALDAAVRPADQVVFESGFEEEVYDFLTDRGYLVDTQVGASGYRIDLAVVHPDRPGVYVTAVECDGASYHGSANARERDRLRDLVLGSLGWRIHRVWSTDWWHEPSAARARLIEAVDAAIREADAPPAAAAPPVRAPSPEPTERVDVAATIAAGVQLALPPDAPVWRGLPPVSGGARDALYEPSALGRVAADLLEVVIVAGPVSRDDAYRHVLAAWDWQSLGSRLVQRCERALRAIPREQRPVERDGFLWPAGLDPATWTAFRPAAVATADRDLGSVPPEEIANAAVWIVAQAVSLTEESLQREVAGAFGVGRLSKRAAGIVAAGVEIAVASGRVVAEDGKLRLA